MGMPMDPLTDGLDRRTLAEIQRKVIQQGKRHAVSRFFLVRGDKDKIAAWKQDLLRVLNVFDVRFIISVGHLQTHQPFQTELEINIHEKVASVYQNVLTGQEGAERVTCYPPTTERL